MEKLFNANVRTYIIYTIVLGLLGYELLSQPRFTDAEIKEVRRSALNDAKANKHSLAIEKIELVSRALNAPDVIADKISILLAAGRAQEALDLAADHDVLQMPKHINAKLAQACQQLQPSSSCDKLLHYSFTNFSQRPDLFISLAPALFSSHKKVVRSYASSIVNTQPEYRQALVDFITPEPATLIATNKRKALLTPQTKEQADIGPPKPDKTPSLKEQLDRKNLYYRSLKDHKNQAIVLEQLAELTNGGPDYLHALRYALLAQEAPNNQYKLAQKLEHLGNRYQQAMFLSEAAALYLRSGYTQEAASTIVKLPEKNLSPGLLEGMAFRLRQQGQSESALEYYEWGNTLYPDNPVFPSGKILALVDTKQLDAAEMVATKHQKQFKRNPGFIKAQLYLSQAKGKRFKQHALSQQLYELDKSDENYARWVMSIVPISPLLAFEKAQKQPDLFTTDQWQRLYADRAAIAIRWSSLGADENNPAQVKVHKTHQANALKYAKENLTYALKNSPVAWHDKARIDLMNAHFTNKQYKEALQVHNKITVPPAKQPAYANNIAGQTYLNLHKPNKAVPLLEMALKKSRENQSTSTALYYAYQESGYYQKADALAQLQLQKSRIPPLRDTVKGRALEAHTLALMASGTAFSNRLPEAEQRTKRLLRKAPNNTSLRLRLASIYRWRGWFDKAAQEYDRVESMNPDNLELASGRFHLAMDTQGFREAERQHNNFVSRHLASPLQKSVTQRWQQHNKWQLISNMRLSPKDGTSKNSFAIDSWLFTPPIASPNYRAFTHHYFATTKFAEGRGKLNRFGVGLEKRNRHLNWQIEVNRDLDDEANKGIRLKADGFINDYIFYRIQWQSYSLLTPLRGINSGVDGKSIELGGGYRWSERHRLSLDYYLLDLSDNNKRHNFSAAFSDLFYSRPRHQISYTLSAYTSKNTLSDRIYFSPSKGQQIGGSLDYAGLLKQQHTMNFSHAAGLGVSIYKQNNFSAKPNTSIYYEHRWQNNENLSFNYGVSLSRNFYDGTAEAGNSIYAGLDWRF